MTDDMKVLEEAAERVTKFCAEWRKMSGLDKETIYSLHRGIDDREAELYTTDLEFLARKYLEQRWRPDR